MPSSVHIEYNPSDAFSPYCIAFSGIRLEAAGQPAAEQLVAVVSIDSPSAIPFESGLICRANLGFERRESRRCLMSLAKAILSAC